MTDDPLLRKRIDAVEHRLSVMESRLTEHENDVLPALLRILNGIEDISLMIARTEKSAKRIEERIKRPNTTDIEP
jgi:hypothetical protein